MGEKSHWTDQYAKVSMPLVMGTRQGVDEYSGTTVLTVRSGR